MLLNDVLDKEVSIEIGPFYSRMDLLAIFEVSERNWSSMLRTYVEPRLWKLAEIFLTYIQDDFFLRFWEMQLARICGHKMSSYIDAPKYPDTISFLEIVG